MNCALFEAQLVDFLEGTQTPEQRRLIDEHLVECNRCRQLLEIVSGELDLLPGYLREDMTRSILELTSGAACDRAQHYLPDLVAGDLGSADARILLGHTERCPHCHVLVGALEELRDELPEMAHLEPDALFTNAVFRATSGRPRDRAMAQTGLTDWWNILIRRPRFAWEAAYAGTLVLLAVFWNPWIPLREPAAEALPAVQMQYRQASEAVFRLGSVLWVSAGGEGISEAWNRVARLSVVGPAIGDRLQTLQQQGEALLETAEDFVVETARSCSLKTYDAFQDVRRGLLGRKGRGQPQSFNGHEKSTAEARGSQRKNQENHRTFFRAVRLSS